MTRRRRRLAMIGVAGVLLSFAVGLTLFGLRDSVVYFYPPSEIAQKAAPGQRVRLGGLVETGSVSRDAAGALLFRVTDAAGGVVPVRYPKDPPDLFRENQGVVAEGVMVDGRFEADMVLAKHDENYMPREVAEALKADGEWRGPVKPQTAPAS